MKHDTIDHDVMLAVKFRSISDIDAKKVNDENRSNGTQQFGQRKQNKAIEDKHSQSIEATKIPAMIVQPCQALYVMSIHTKYKYNQQL